MIALASNCLLFQTRTGESIPLSPEMICVELSEDSSDLFDPEFVQHAANAVFHYFKVDQARKSVTIAEFAEALEKVLKGFKVAEPAPSDSVPRDEVIESDLARIAVEAGSGCELFFFPRLRDELRQLVQQAPRMLRFSGLRKCVMELTGARRWSARCQCLEEQIVQYLRRCLSAESVHPGFSLLVK
jgi:hypothetical protein